MGNLYKLVYIFILLYNYTSLIFVDGLLEAVTDANVIIFNETHLKLNWTYPGTEKEVGFNILKSAVENVIINNKTVQNGTFYTNKTEYYDEYSEGVRYYYRIESCYNTTYCKLPKNIFINTPINLNLNITGCTDNKFNYLDSKKIIQGNTFICLSTNPLLTNDEICNNSIYPTQETDKLKPCNTTGNEMSCNANYTIYGFVRNPTSDNNYTLIFNLTKVSENLTITTVTTKNSNGSVEESSSTLLIVIIVLIIIILITVLGIIFYLKKYKNTKKDIEITEIETEMAPLNKPMPLRPPPSPPTKPKRMISRMTKSFSSKPKPIKPKPLTKEELQDLLYNYDSTNNELDTEYESIVVERPDKLTKPNKEKNRYGNILPYEFNRVKLGHYDGYINASYINGFNGCDKYIATQGPTTATIDDFWAMIWQEKVEAIVMITGLIEENKEKCQQYWPDNSKTYDQNLDIHYIKTTQHLGFLIREFELHRQDESRNIKQLHFTSWRDYGVPHSPHNMINFMKFFRKQKFRTPIVVHCSAGVGRTGSFILCDYLMDQAELNQPIDIVSGLVHLRKCRNGMVNKPIQYKLVYCTMLEYLINKERVISIQELKRNLSIYTTELHCLDDLEFINEAQYWNKVLFDQMSHSSYEICQDKCRSKTLVLSCKGFVYLDYYPIEDVQSNYINANIVNNFYENKTFISTQNPLPNTIGDFWRMIAKEEIELIIVLQTIGFSNNNPIFWPETEDIMNPVDYMELKSETIEEYASHDEVTLELLNGNERKKINLMHFKNWTNERYPNKEDFLDFIKKTMNTTQRNITIVCRDGGSVCGIYLSFLKITEQIKTEKVFDICSAVRTLRLHRNDFMTDAKQFVYVYKLIGKYLDPIYENYLQLLDDDGLYTEVL